ncbi:PTS sugar transporter subunit IIA [Caviibacter abscessus]|uniref:PTS sugar transporter subunit IIA n=1 Tax=Caviibacter abscessus TaxID=1766719 RepID=UPI00082F6372|nr:PTS sugar transporter subunit IIA [Caviibacter abscessus]
MKKVASYLKLNAVELNLESIDKKGVLKELFGKLSSAEEIIDEELCFKDLMDREKLGSTGIGKGVAVPHAKTKGVKELIMTLGISKNPISYDSIDNEDVNIFFMFLSPVELSQEYLIILARISRFIRDDVFRKQLLNAKTSNEIFEILEAKEIQ